MIELYMLTEKYNISLNDKLQEKKKYKMKMKAINIYNYLFNQWLITEKNKKVSNKTFINKNLYVSFGQ